MENCTAHASRVSNKRLETWLFLSVPDTFGHVFAALLAGENQTGIQGMPQHHARQVTSTLRGLIHAGVGDFPRFSGLSDSNVEWCPWPEPQWMNMYMIIFRKNKFEFRKTNEKTNILWCWSSLETHFAPLAVQARGGVVH